MIDREYQCLSCGRVSLKIITQSGCVLAPVCITPGCLNNIAHHADYEKNPEEWECVDGLDQEYRDLYPVRKKLLRRQQCQN